MDISQVKTWVVSSDHMVRPKNPYDNWSDADYRKESLVAFEDFATQHTYHTDPTLAPGDYPAEKFGDVVWQYSVTSGRSWEIEIDEDTHRDSLNVGLLTRLYLGLAAPISNENKEGEDAGWIGVRDRLPEIDTNTQSSNVYLVLSDTLIFQARLINFGEQTIWVPILPCITNYSITHWMPLPSPPKSI